MADVCAHAVLSYN